jgi:hypothetical protein
MLEAGSDKQKPLRVPVRWIVTDAERQRLRHRSQRRRSYGGGSIVTLPVVVMPADDFGLAATIVFTDAARMYSLR